MKHRFWGLRGKAYGQKRREVFEEIKDDLKARFLEICDSKKEGRRFTWNDYGKLANEFLLPCTVLNTYLAAMDLLPSHVWQCAVDRGLKASDIGVRWSDKSENKEAIA